MENKDYAAQYGERLLRPMAPRNFSSMKVKELIGLIEADGWLRTHSSPRHAVAGMGGKAGASRP